MQRKSHAPTATRQPNNKKRLYRFIDTASFAQQKARRITAKKQITKRTTHASKKTSTLETNTEQHPWAPFAPANAKILFLGSFPPPRIRWSMDFYYPNINNDFWRIMGIIFFDEKEYFIDKDKKQFKEGEIKKFLTEKGIALYDAATAVRRLSNNASDAHLHVVQPTDIAALLGKMPQCDNIVVTGEKAAETILSPHGIAAPKIGESITLQYGQRQVKLWRMPSTSRAYPLATEKKAAFYYALFTTVQMA